MDELLKSRASPEEKKHKLEDVHFDPQQIPIEIWEQIFFYIDGEDLKILSLVCKLFYIMIGELLIAMSKIVLIIDRKSITPDFQQVILDSSRNYTSILFANFEKVQDIGYEMMLEKLLPNLKSIQFFRCHLNRSEWNQIFEQIHEKLTEIIIKESKTRQSDSTKCDDLQGNIKFTQLKKLVLFKSDIIFDFRCAPDTLLELKFSPDNSYYNVDENHFLQLLERQNVLKHLTLDLPSHQTSYFEMLDETTMDFPLVSLEIILEYCEDITEELCTFIRSKYRSLKTLKIVNLSIHERESMIEYLVNLESLEIHCNETREYQSGPNFSCPSLKKLSLNFKSDRSINFVNRFINLEEINFLKFNTYENLKKTTENSPNLKKLMIQNFSDDNFKDVVFDNVVELEIDSNRYFLENHDLDYVFTSIVNLKVLKFGKTFALRSVLLLWILENFEYLERIEIENGSRLKLNFLCEKAELIGKLRYLKIKNISEPTVKLKKCLDQFSNLQYSLYNIRKSGNNVFEESEDESESSKGSVGESESSEESFDEWW